MTVDELITNNIKLVPYTIKLLNCNYYDKDEYEELYHAGLIGLIEGAKCYDFSQPYRSSFFVSCIKNSIMNRVFSKHCRKYYFDFRKLTVSLNRQITNDEETELMELLPSDYNLEEDFFQILVKQELYENLDKLKPTYKQILVKRYGLENGREMTLEEIASDVGISRQAVNEKYRRAIRDLKKIYEVK